jgi:hypothetical protein
VIEVAAEHGWARGGRVVGIGDADLAPAVAAVDALVPHDNPANLRAIDPGYLVLAEVLHGLGLSPSAERTAYRVAGADGEVRTLELAPVADLGAVAWLPEGDPPALPLHRQKTSYPYWNHHDAATGTLYLAYNQCADRGRMTFAELVAGTFGFVDQRPVERLVIDLRANGGGNSALLAPLIAGLDARPALRRPGALYALVGRATYSSALLNALELRAHGALIAGEPTGGKPNHFGEVAKLELPRSRLAVQYSTKFFRRVADDPPSLVPDLPVEVTAADYFGRRDPVLEAVIAHSRRALAGEPD